MHLSHSHFNVDQCQAIETYVDGLTDEMSLDAGLRQFQYIFMAFDLVPRCMLSGTILSAPINRGNNSLAVQPDQTGLSKRS